MPVCVLERGRETGFPVLEYISPIHAEAVSRALGTVHIRTYAYKASGLTYIGTF